LSVSDARRGAVLDVPEKGHRWFTGRP